MIKAVFKTIKIGICSILLLSMMNSCGAPKEGCGMDPSLDYNKVDSTKPQKRKKGKSELFSKEHRKRMKKRSS